MKSSTISVLVNGSPTKKIKPTQGLRQGDLMATFLFLIVVDAIWSCMFIILIWISSTEDEWYGWMDKW